MPTGLFSRRAFNVNFVALASWEIDSVWAWIDRWRLHLYCERRMKMYEMLSLYFQQEKNEPCKESCFQIIRSLDLEHCKHISSEQSTKLCRWRQTERLQARRTGLFAFRVNWIKTEEFGNDKLILTGLQSKRCHKKLVTPRGCECKADRPRIAEKVCFAVDDRFQLP